MFQNNQNDLWMISIQLLFDCELDMAMKTTLLFTTLYILYISIKINAFNVDTRRFPDLFDRSLGRFQRSMEKPGIDTVFLRFRNGWENFNTFFFFQHARMWNFKVSRRIQYENLAFKGTENTSVWCIRTSTIV